MHKTELHRVPSITATKVTLFNEFCLNESYRCFLVSFVNTFAMFKHSVIATNEKSKLIKNHV